MNKNQHCKEHVNSIPTSKPDNIQQVITPPLPLAADSQCRDRCTPSEPLPFQVPALVLCTLKKLRSQMASMYRVAKGQDLTLLLLSQSEVLLMKKGPQHRPSSVWTLSKIHVKGTQSVWSKMLVPSQTIYLH